MFQIKTYKVVILTVIVTISVIVLASCTVGGIALNLAINKVEDSVEVMQDKLDGLFDAGVVVKDTVETISESSGDRMTVDEEAAEVAKKATEETKVVYEAAEESVEAAGKEISEAASEATDEALAEAKAAVETAQSATQDFVESYDQTIELVYNVAKASLETIFDATPEEITTIDDAITQSVNAAKEAGQAAKEAFEGVVEAIETVSDIVFG